MTAAGADRLRASPIEKGKAAMPPSRIQRYVAFLAACLWLLATAGEASAQWKHTVIGLPDYVVEGSALRFTVAYEAPESVHLNAEVKDTANVVHVRESRTVVGRGRAEFAIPIPAGKFPGVLVVAIWFGEDWRSPRAQILHTDQVRVYTVQERAQAEESDRRAEALRRKLNLVKGRPIVGIVSGGWAGRSAGLADGLARRLRKSGMTVTLLGPDLLVSRRILHPDYIRLLVIPEAETYPGLAVPTLDAYLRSGGHLVALGAPAFDRLVRRLGSEWIDDQQIAERINAIPATRSLLDPTSMAPARWTRSSNDMKPPTTWSAEPGPSGPALRHQIANLSGWDTIETRLDRSAAPGDNMITLRAKGSAHTTSVAIELREQDGSRWIGVARLTSQWRRLALPASAFALWDPDGTSGRNGIGDKVNLQAIERVAIGLAFTHTSVPGGKHDYEFSDLGSAHGPEITAFHAPILETISPAYKLYPIRGGTSIKGSASRVLIGATPPALPGELLSTHPRPQGSGFDKDKRYRWIPLLEVHGKQGVAGTIATLICHTSGSYAGGRWASFTVPGRAWYLRNDVGAYVVACIQRILRPEMLSEAGSQYFGYFPDDVPKIMARAVGGAKGLSVRCTVRPNRPGARAIIDRTVAMTGSATGRQAAIPWTGGRLVDARYQVRIVLLAKGKPIDEIQHEFTVRTPGGNGRFTGFVTTRDGQFVVDGKPWYPHGVNYMPSSGIAAENGHYFEQWLSSESYDPIVIERDLSRIAAMGLDNVSVFIYIESTYNRNLIDLLNRCEAHGLRVNLSLRPGTPLDFHWPGIGDIITANRLAEDPTVFAYDLAWEPMWRERRYRQRWDAAWEAWLVERYGSVDAAERTLGESIPREAGKVVGPNDADVQSTSQRPKVVAAYRRFLDDLLSRTHMEARQKIRSRDRRHLISFRMAHAGDPTVGPQAMPYDFAGLARSMDFMSPEGYGRIGDWERVKPGWFTAAYAHMQAPEKPVLWAEFGYTLWSKGMPTDAEPGLTFADRFDRRNYPPQTLTFTEEFYRAFYEMALKSGSAGTVCWWYPGGFRYGENSDFGIINPDGTWRTLSRIVREYADKFKNRHRPADPDVWLTVDRDRHPDGLFGIYTEVGKEFWALIEAGKNPGLRRDHTADSLLGVGNVPYAGVGPLRDWNGEFDSVLVGNAAGGWTGVPYPEGPVTVKGGAAVRIRVRAGNNGYEDWTAGADRGAVALLAREARTGQVLRAELSNRVPRLGASNDIELSLPPPDGETEWSITLEARGIGLFGEVRRILLRRQ